MVNPQALDTFVRYDKKSFMAGVVVGQGLKGRARAPQTPAPAGFPQGLWDDAVERTNAMIASLQSAGQSTATPETPNDWQFDKDAFCFGIAAGRSLEGWEIDGAVNLWDALMMYYVHIEQVYEVQLYFYSSGGGCYIDWGDGSKTSFSPGRNRSYSVSHNFQAGDYIIIVYSNSSIYPLGLKSNGSMSWGSSISADRPHYVTNDFEILRGVYLSGNIPCIGECAFRFCANLAGVVIPESVTSIGDYAFSGCRGLTSITIPDSITSIGDWAFNSCVSLPSFVIPSSVISIGKLAFGSCHTFTSVTIPDGVTSISSGTFDNCSALVSVTIPDSVTSIEHYAFSACHSLTNIKIPNSVISIGYYAFDFCDSLTSIIIPNGVTSIEDRTFQNCYSLASVSIPDSVTSIEHGAFSYCTSLTSITIPSSVASIEYGAFDGCERLTSVIIPNGITAIYSDTFRNCCSLAIVTIPSSVTKIAGNAFQGCRSLVDVYYGGTEEQWESVIHSNMGFNYSDRYLLDATIHYNSTEPNND